jgi:hypothetical protein
VALFWDDAREEPLGLGPFSNSADGPRFVFPVLDLGLEARVSGIGASVLDM